MAEWHGGDDAYRRAATEALLRCFCEAGGRVTLWVPSGTLDPTGPDQAMNEYRRELFDAGPDIRELLSSPDGARYATIRDDPEPYPDFGTPATEDEELPF